MPCNNKSTDCFKGSNSQVDSADTKRLDNLGTEFEWTKGNDAFEWRVPNDGIHGYIEIDRDVQLWRFVDENEETCGRLETRYLKEINQDWQFH